MDFFALLTMIGGLALFLFGMKTMGDSLAKLAGGKLEHVLERMTSNPFKAVLMGAGVTAVIQSSSATTVMVVGFVNSGIMKLSRAVGVIMGANVGTTVTSWILSLTGIEGSNFFVRLLKPSSFSPILALIGIVFIMFSKKSRKNDIGMILIGFAVLMFGMETMSAAVKPLADLPEFTSLFTAFENPFLGMLVGAGLTAAIQSSSASVGILQAMCLSGSVSVSAALPIIMGQNIGTCITAMVSSVGANKNAKRAAIIHLYFNVIGTLLFMGVFYLLNSFLHFSFMQDAANVQTIAIIHTCFNIAATAVLLPASKLLVKLAYLTIPQTEDENLDTSIKVLDERFLERPAFAVAQCKTASCEIANLVEKAMELAAFSDSSYNEQALDEIIRIEDDIDDKQDELSTYLTRLAAKPLTEQDSKNIGLYGKCTVDFERISDYLKGIAYIHKKLDQEEESFSESAVKDLRVIYEAAREIVEETVSCFIHDDWEVAMAVDPLAEVIGELKRDIRLNHNKRLSEGLCSVEMGLSLTDIVNSLGRIAGHCSNIAEEEIAKETDMYELHQYARSLKEGNEKYRDMVGAYRMKYSLSKARKTLK